jgi:ribosome assembly protein YihI (activator of Der GTPase)
LTKIGDTLAYYYSSRAIEAETKKRKKKEKKSKSGSAHPGYAINQSSAYAAAAAERRITGLIALPTWFVDAVEDPTQSSSTS